MSLLGKDLHEYLASKGVACGWMKFRRELDKRAAQEKICTRDLTIHHPLVTSLVNELKIWSKL